MYGQHFFVTCQAYCKDYICCKLFYLSVFLYRKMYSINKYNGINLVKRTFLPLFYLRKETVCDIGYHTIADFKSVNIFDSFAYLASVMPFAYSEMIFCSIPEISF